MARAIGVRTKAGRIFLASILLALCAFATWAWIRPYETTAKPGLGARIMRVELKRDRGYRWLTIDVKMMKHQSLDLSRPIRLRIAADRMLEPADTRLSGNPESGFHEIRVKFWLEGNDLDQPLALQIQGGELSVKRDPSNPQLKNGESRTFTTDHWNSWIGF